MRVLLIKTSSMGDIIHSLPALTDASKAIPALKVDWIVEEDFAEIPLWHPAVAQVFPISLRQWRKSIFSLQTRAAWQALKQQLKHQSYDYILDAQGLVKSAIFTRYARGKRVGLDWASAREALASLFYQQKHTVDFHQHAVVRMRQLFSQALNYAIPETALDYGLSQVKFAAPQDESNYLVFLHGTTWDTKLWPETYWMKLADIVAAAGFRVKISGGNAQEFARAKRIAEHAANVDALPRLTISEMASLLAHAKAAIAVDTGFGHLAAALNTPVVSVYGATDPNYTGALGKNSLHLTSTLACSPCLSRTCTYQGKATQTPACYQEITPALVWKKLLNIL